MREIDREREGAETEATIGEPRKAASAQFERLHAALDEKNMFAPGGASRREMRADPLSDRIMPWPMSSARLLPRPSDRKFRA